VLSEWIVDAALLDGFPTHGTSIPGVAQRTGSTTYYVELYTERGGEEPAFSLYPVPGALDVLVAPEFMEVGRMIELGFVSPARTTVICSTHRLLSIHEKIATGRAIYPQEGLQRAASAAAQRLIAFDALALARQHGTEANAVLLGALAGSGAVPISEASFRKAIESKGVAVKSNLAGFDLGLALARSPSAAGSAPAPPRPPPPTPCPLTSVPVSTRCRGQSARSFFTRYLGFLTIRTSPMRVAISTCFSRSCRLTALLRRASRWGGRSRGIWRCG